MATAMGSSVFVRLKDGSRVVLLADVAPTQADALRRSLDRWVRDGQALAVAHATGSVEDVSPQAIEAIEVVPTASQRRRSTTSERR